MSSGWGTKSVLMQKLFVFHHISCIRRKETHGYLTLYIQNLQTAGEVNRNEGSSNRKISAYWQLLSQIIKTFTSVVNFSLLEKKHRIWQLNQYLWKSTG